MFLGIRNETLLLAREDYIHIILGFTADRWMAWPYLETMNTNKQTASRPNQMGLNIPLALTRAQMCMISCLGRCVVVLIDFPLWTRLFNSGIINMLGQIIIYLSLNIECFAVFLTSTALCQRHAPGCRCENHRWIKTLWNVPWENSQNCPSENQWPLHVYFIITIHIVWWPRKCMLYHSQIFIHSFTQCWGRFKNLDSGLGAHLPEFFSPSSIIHGFYDLGHVLSSFLLWVPNLELERITTPNSEVSC